MLLLKTQNFLTTKLILELKVFSVDFQQFMLKDANLKLLLLAIQLQK